MVANGMLLSLVLGSTGFLFIVDFTENFLKNVNPAEFFDDYKIFSQTG